MYRIPDDGRSPENRQRCTPTSEPFTSPLAFTPFISLLALSFSLFLVSFVHSSLRFHYICYFVSSHFVTKFHSLFPWARQRGSDPSLRLRAFLLGPWVEPRVTLHPSLEIGALNVTR
jgi:hypothetical protein